MRIYLSSTSTDLAEERKTAIATLRGLGHEVVYMEKYTAEGRPPLERCLKDVTGVDLYVGILAWHYGDFPPPPDDSVSFTEHEYNEACGCNIPTLCFVLHDNVTWPPHLRDTGDMELRIQGFRERIKKDKMVSFFTNPADLAVKIKAAMNNRDKVNDITPTKDISAGAAATHPSDGSINLKPPMIGQKGPRKNLIDALENVLEENRARFVFVRGEDGAGKGKLIEWFCSQINKQKKDILVYGGSYFVDSSSCYCGIRKILQQVFCIKDSELYRTREIVSTKFREWKVDTETNPIDFYVDFIQPETISDSGGLEPDEKVRNQQRGIFFSRLARPLIIASQRNPLVIYFENLHFADEGSILFIEHLLACLREIPGRLMIVCLYDPSYTKKNNKTLQHAITHISERYDSKTTGFVTLSPLNETEMVTLIQEMLWGAKLQGVEKIIKIAQGNPKLIVAIMRYLVDKECLREQGNGKAWILPETTDTAAMIPTEIRGIYEARLEKIENSGEEGSWRRQIIDWAALIGERFSERLLEAALKAGGETALHAGLTPALKYLVNDARIFRRSREVGSSDLEFSEGLLMHGIVLENIEYDTPNRHGFIAKAMQELNRTSGINSVAPQLALHYLCAGEPENAVIYFKIAADVARNKYNFSDACTYLRKADELLKKPYLNEKESRSRLAILLALGDLAGINNVSFSDAQACYSEAQRIAREIGAEQEQVRALIGLGNVAQLRGSMLIAEEWYDKAKKLCIEKSLEDLRSRILKDIAQVYLRTAVDYQKAEIACNEWLADNSRKKETASDDMASEADVRRIRGTVYLYTGYLDNAKNDFTNALSLAEGIGDMRQTAYCNNCIGEVYRKQGQPEIAERYHQQAFEERKKLGDMVGIAMSNNNLGLIKKALHQNEAAKEYFNNAIRTDRDIGSKHREADSLNNLATLSRMMGDYDTAFPLYSKSLKLYSDCNLKNEEMIVKGNIALIQYERGDVQGATEIFENSAKVFEKNGNLACAALVYHNLIFLKRKQEAGESHEEDLKNKFIGARGKLQGYRWPAPVINGDFSTMVDMEDI